MLEQPQQEHSKDPQYMFGSKNKKRYKLVMIRKRRNQKKTPTPKTVFGTRKCVYETLCPQLVSHFQDVKMSKK